MTPCSQPHGCCGTSPSGAARSRACSRTSRRPCPLPSCAWTVPTTASSTSWRAPRSTSPRGIPCPRWTACGSRSPTAGACCAPPTRSRCSCSASRPAPRRRSRRTASKSSDGSPSRAYECDARPPAVGVPARRWSAGRGSVGGRWLALETTERAWAATIPGGGMYLMLRDLARLVRGLFLLAAIGWATGNLLFVYRAIGSVQLPRRLGDLEIVEAVPQRLLLAGTVACGLVYGVLLTLGTGDAWQEAALAARPPTFGIADPVLHRDVGYYLARLPWTERLRSFALVATLSATAIVALLYLGIGSLRFRRWLPYASAHARAHLGVLLACLGLTLTWGALLDPVQAVADR